MVNNIVNNVLFRSNKPNPAVINHNKGVLNGNNHGDGVVSGKSCESCQGKLSVAGVLSRYREIK